MCAGVVEREGCGHRVKAATECARFRDTKKKRKKLDLDQSELSVRSFFLFVCIKKMNNNDALVAAMNRNGHWYDHAIDSPISGVFNKPSIQCDPASTNGCDRLSYRLLLSATCRLNIHTCETALVSWKDHDAGAGCRGCTVAWWPRQIGPVFPDNPNTAVATSRRRRETQMCQTDCVDSFSTFENDLLSQHWRQEPTR